MHPQWCRAPPVASSSSIQSACNSAWSAVVTSNGVPTRANAAATLAEGPLAAGSTANSLAEIRKTGQHIGAIDGHHDAPD